MFIFLVTATLLASITTTAECGCIWFPDIYCSDLGDIDSVPPLTVNVMSPSRTLTITGRTRLQSIQANAFKGISSINMVHLSIRYVDPSAFQRQPWLGVIYLSDNRIRSISQGTFMDSNLNYVDLSANEIESLTTGTFSGIISTLILSDNWIRIINDYTFSNVSFLNKLDLSSNKVTDISEYTFYGLSSLGILSLQRNSIVYVSPSAFTTLNRLRELNLRDNLITSILFLESTAPSLYFMDIGGNQLSNFTSLPGRFTYLAIDNNVLADLPTFKNGSKLSRLTATGNGLVSISDGHFVNCTSVNTLNIAVNNITDITASTFLGLTSLVQLFASQNNINSLPLGSFADQKQLAVLDLRDNLLTTLVPGIFDNCSSLYQVLLARNRLSAIPFKVFNNLPVLGYVDLASNQLRILSNQTFVNVPNLNSVDISNNQINWIASGAFEPDNTKLINVDVSKNQLANLLFAVDSWPTLSTFILTGNRFTVVSLASLILPCSSTVKLDRSTITKLDNVTIVFQCLQTKIEGAADFSDNQITTITPLAFSKSYAITSLNLSFNQLTSIKSSTLYGLDSLRSLDLSNNQLTSIESDAFVSLQSLQNLKLGHNLLLAYIAASLSPCVGLLYLDVSANLLGDEFFSDVALTTLSQLKMLTADNIGASVIQISDISHVGQSRRRRAAFASAFPKMTTLSLRGNRITRLTDFGGTALMELDLGQNNISADFMSYDLPNFGYLNKISLDNNRITSVAASSLPNSLIYLDISNNQINYVNGSFPSSLRYVDLSNNTLTSSSLQGAFSTASGLQTLKLDANCVERLTGLGLNGTSSSFRKLSIADNELSDDAWNVISKLIGLVEINLNGNNLTMIPDSVFKELYHIETILLSGNQITELGPLFLDGIEQSYGSQLTLNISHNSITTVDPMAFHRRLPQLTVLDLSSNRLSTLVLLPPRLFNLKVLRLDNNQLEAFPSGPIQFGSIEILNVSYNFIEKLPDIYIYNVNGFVKVVDFSFNRLTGLGDLCLIGSFINVAFQGNKLSSQMNSSQMTSSCGFSKLVHIEHFNLAANGFVDENWNFLESLSTFVAKLNLDNNLLTTLSGFRKTSMTTTAVVEISLAHNLISVVQDGFLASIYRSIQVVDLVGNRLQRLNKSALAPINSVINGEFRSLRLADNPWRCDCSLAWLTDESFRRVIDGVRCLTPISASGNYVTCVDFPRYCFNTNDTLEVGSGNKSAICDAPNNSNATYTPVVFTVSPLFGPVAGGTTLTIAGQGLNRAELQVVLLPVDDTRYKVIMLLPPNADSVNELDTLVRITPEVHLPIEARTHLGVSVIFPPVFTGKFFDYRPNPVIVEVSPRDQQLSGGTLVTLTGRNMDAAAVPLIRVVTVLERSNDSTTVKNITASNFEKCFNVSATSVTCPMPRVPLLSDAEYFPNTTKAIIQDSPPPVAESGTGTSASSSGQRASIYVGVIFDGYRYYDNFSSSLPSAQFKFYSPPVINSSTQTMLYYPSRQGTIDIHGKNMRLGAQLVDYKVSIGSIQCIGKELTNNVLRCQPPIREPPTVGNADNWCTRQQLNSIGVRIGNLDPILYSCIRYVDEPVNIGLIVGPSVGLGTLLIFIIIVIIVVCWIKRKRKSQTESVGVYSPQLPNSTTISEPGYNPVLRLPVNESPAPQNKRQVNNFPAPTVATPVFGEYLTPYKTVASKLSADNLTYRPTHSTELNRKAIEIIQSSRGRDDVTQLPDVSIAKDSQ